jgi:hypothetical protein
LVACSSNGIISGFFTGGRVVGAETVFACPTEPFTSFAACAAVATLIGLVVRFAESDGGSFDGAVGGSAGGCVAGMPSIVPAFARKGGESVAASGGDLVTGVVIGSGAFATGAVSGSADFVTGIVIGSGACGIGAGSGDGSSGRERGAGLGAVRGAAIGGGVGVRGGGAARGGGSRLPQWPHSRASSGFSCAQKGQNRIGPLS